MRAASLTLALLPALLLGGPALAQTRPQTYIALGDSITVGVGDDTSRARLGYPPRLEDLLKNSGTNVVLNNQGQGALRTTEALSKLDGILSNLGQPGDVLLLMIGTGDISKELSIETATFNIDQMASRAEAHGLRAIHGTILPRIPNSFRDPENIETQRLSEMVRSLANRRGRQLVDVFHYFTYLPNAFGAYYWLDPEDGVGHPNAAGYDLMARLYYDVIVGRDTVPPVTGLVDPPTGSREVPGLSAIQVELLDFGSGIDLNQTRLLVNGTEVSAAVVGSGRRILLSYGPQSPLSGLVRLGIRARDTAATPNVEDRVVASFLVAGTTFFTGDLDQDGRVDGRDLVILGRSFGSHAGETRFARRADLNADGTVDGQDLAQLAANFGRTSG